MFTATPSRQQAVEFACNKLNERPVYLDTETTGLDRNAEIIEIAILDHDGSLLYESFVRPSVAIPSEAIRVHHITNAMVEKAPTWPAIWPTVRGLLLGRMLAIYNAEFDLRMMQQSLMRYRLPMRDRFNSMCVMEAYASFRGEWDPSRRAVRRFSLDAACRSFSIPIAVTHRAREDARMARDVLRRIAGLND
jgi:DNA polymerase-3 subunit epsilon